jgi:hypothetical protein
MKRDVCVTLHCREEDTLQFNEIQRCRILLNFYLSINQDLANLVINIVKRDLGTPLPIRLIPDQHLLILTRYVTDPGQVAADINSRFNAKILEIYGGEINGILVGVPDAKILDEIMKDPRIAYRGQDKRKNCFW